MTPEFNTHRPLVAGNDWMVVSGSPFASQAGADILNAGGNAVDAAIAANAVLGVVRPHMSGPGGDLFALVYMANTGKVSALNASGRSPGRASLDALTAKGHQKIPVKGVLSATVPGVVDGWQQLSDRYGCLPFEALFERAVELAQRGFPVYSELTQMIEMEGSHLTLSHGAKSLLFREGRPLQPGERLVQADLGRSLEYIAKQGANGFYQGEIGRSLVAHSDAAGGLFTMDDLAAHRSTWSDPLFSDYKGVTLCTHPPNSQGIAWLMTANIAGMHDFKRLGHNTADYVHLIVEAKKLAFADRDRYVSDPEFSKIPVDRLLGRTWTRKQQERINMSRAGQARTPLDFQSRGEDTVYLAVVDRHGNAVSLIQSLYEGFGSCSVIDGTGIFLHNRGRDFRTDRAHVNCLEPGKRPYHTLTPAMILRQGRPAWVLGSPGADGQTQTLIQVAANLIDFGADAQQAVEAPRWRSNPDGSLTMESRFDPAVIEELAGRGHQIDLKGEFDLICGGAQVIGIDHEKGFLTAGADPRRQGYAMGY